VDNLKPKNFILTALAIVILGVGLWWFCRTPASIPEKTAKLAPAAAARVPEPITPSKVAPPVVPPAPTPANATNPANAQAAKPADPQTDLKTAVLDIGRLIRDGGDPEAFRETYTAPDELTAQLVEKIHLGMQRRADLAIQNPFFARINQEVVKDMARDYESLENLTPAYNAAGNEATYAWTHYYQDGATSERSRTFVKINGKWYLKLGDTYSE
jgi:hypothetical protein